MKTERPGQQFNRKALRKSDYEFIPGKARAKSDNRLHAGIGSNSIAKTKGKRRYNRKYNNNRGFGVNKLTCTAVFYDKRKYSNEFIPADCIHPATFHQGLSYIIGVKNIKLFQLKPAFF